MRHVIEITSQKAGKSFTKFLSDEVGGAKVIDSYDPKEKLTKQVEQVGLALREFKSSGISWDVFTTYLRGRGFSQKLIDSMLGEVKSFFKKMGLLE